MPNGGRERVSALEAVLEAWRSGRDAGRWRVDVTSPPVPPRLADFPRGLHPRVVSALVASGVGRPWSHQVEAWEAIERRRNVVVATPPASGKTLCYDAPALSALANEPDRCALYLFPTKALARDQEQALRNLARAARVEASVGVYDGDTPPDERRAIRESASIVITNPDMLHAGILPHHAAWSRFLGRLELVVLDELHQYRGVFGSHVANVLRRLSRVTAFHGGSPVFVACSATIRNPVELAEALTGREFVLVGESGAPSGPRTFMVHDPGVLDETTGARRSMLSTAARLAADLVRAGVRVLVFCQSRRSVEIALRDLRERLGRAGVAAALARGYRGGYLPALRREIEAGLRNGNLLAVVATNALELGIDVGTLDAVILAGYPGTVAGLRQRAGRAGRRLGPSVAVLVAGASPLDQFLAREPGWLLESSPEAALVQPDNVEILLAHVRCAAFELPFEPGERFGSLTVEETGAALECLARDGILVESGGRHHHVGEGYPAAEVSLRSVQGSSVVVADDSTGEILSEVDGRRARLELHEGAIYQHEGETHEVLSLDLEGRRAVVRAVDARHFTVAVCAAEVRVLDERGRAGLGRCEAGSGAVRVTERVSGFRRIRFRSHEVLGVEPLSLPPFSMESEAAWIAPGAGFAEAAGISTMDLALALEGAGHALHQVSAVRLMCDPHDLGLAVQEAGSAGIATGGGLPALFVYDAYPGGVGLAARLFDEMAECLRDAARLVRGCSCSNGCPSCVGPRAGSGPSSREIAMSVLCALAPLESGR